MYKVYCGKEYSCRECEKNNIPVIRIALIFDFKLDLCQECISKAFKDYEKGDKYV
jgi:hypothetical protein